MQRILTCILKSNREVAVNSIAWEDIKVALPTLQPVQGGFTKARRGIVTLPDGKTVFIKIATDELTKKWINQEREAYHWLTGQGFAHMPALLAETDGGIALPNLQAWDWSENSWTDSKLEVFLQAIDDLAVLGNSAKGHFENLSYGKNFWPELTQDVSAYQWLHKYVLDEEWHALEAIFANKQQCQTYNALAATEPWRGTDLTHSDVRADNCAYNQKTGEVQMVDWNWLCLGNKRFDESMLFVNAAKAGADLRNFVGRFDKACLAAIMGIWLASAEREAPDEHMTTLRLFQLQNALTAHSLLQQAP